MDYKSVISSIDFEAYRKAMDNVIKDLLRIHANCPNLGDTAISITSRIKDECSIENKMIKKNISNCCDPSTIIHDIAGVRCIFSCDVHKDDIKILEEYINKKVDDLKEKQDFLSFYNCIRDELISIFEFYSLSDFKQNCDISSIYNFLLYFKNNSNYKIVNSKDFFTNPKRSGYRGYHIVVRTKDGLDVEIQFRTFLQHIWSQLEHKFIYKCKSLGINDVPKEIKDFFVDASNRVDDISRFYAYEYIGINDNFVKH